MTKLLLLYKNDPDGLQQVTILFKEQLMNFCDSFSQLTWTDVHRNAHRLKTTAALFELYDLMELLNQIHDCTMGTENAAALVQFEEALRNQYSISVVKLNTLIEST